MTYNICMILQLKILYVKMKFNNSGIKKVSRPTPKAGKSAVYAASRLSVVSGQTYLFSKGQNHLSLRNRRQYCLSSFISTAIFIIPAASISLKDAYFTRLPLLLIKTKQTPKWIIFIPISRSAAMLYSFVQAKPFCLFEDK